ncbi:MAG: hypothetical protein U0231_01040 [Nitrospiraceae bacterium]
MITVDEAYGYVSKKVPEVTGQNQHPVKKGEVEGQLILGRPGAVTGLVWCSSETPLFRHAHWTVRRLRMSSSWSRIGVAVAIGFIGLAGCTEVETVKAPIEVPSRIYTASSSNDVSVIDATSYTPVGSIESKNQSTHDIAISRDGPRVAHRNLASGRLGHGR